MSQSDGWERTNVFFIEDKVEMPLFGVAISQGGKGNERSLRLSFVEAGLSAASGFLRANNHVIWLRRPSPKMTLQPPTLNTQVPEPDERNQGSPKARVILVAIGYIIFA